MNEILAEIARGVSEIADAIAKSSPSSNLPLRDGWVVFGTLGDTDNAIAVVRECDYYGVRLTFYDMACGSFSSNDIFVPWHSLGHIEIATDEDDIQYCISKWLHRLGLHRSSHVEVPS